jgi:hypothetical protein
MNWFEVSGGRGRKQWFSEAPADVMAGKPRAPEGSDAYLALQDCIAHSCPDCAERTLSFGMPWTLAPTPSHAANTDYRPLMSHTACTDCGPLMSSTANCNAASYAETVQSQFFEGYYDPTTISIA